VPELTPTELLDPDVLLGLSRGTDPIGVLSVYVTTDLGSDAGLRAAGIDIRNRLRELRMRVAQEGPPQRARALDKGIDGLQDAIAALLEPGVSGRGQVLFGALSDGAVTRFTSRLPLPNRVVLDAGPFLHPLLELVDEGRPAGVVLAAQDEARVLEWRLGELTELDRLVPAVVEAPHERSGPVGSSPSSRAGSPKAEQRAAREREQASRFLDDLGAATERAAAGRGWERVMVSGGDRLTGPLASALESRLAIDVVRDPRLLAQLSPAQLAGAVSEQLHAVHDAYEAKLVDQAREAAGALGLSQVAAALNEARVAHLIYDPEVRYQGSVAQDGSLYAGGEAPAGAAPLTEETRLTERLLERALETRARVTPAEGAATGGLADAGGIAALLRW
jgi:hypothetical protein